MNNVYSDFKAMACFTAAADEGLRSIENLIAFSKSHKHTDLTPAGTAGAWFLDSTSSDLE
jgi:hypothetical protein